MIKIIIFDFDGVLVESVGIKTRAFAKLFEKERKDLVDKIVDYHLENGGVSRYEKFKYIYKEILRRPLNAEEFQALCSRFAAIVVEDVIGAPYVRGAKEFLENHAAEYKYFVVSATPQGEIEEIIRKRNMHRFFAGVYGAPAEKYAVVREILAKENIEPKNVAYIGDAMSDYLAAEDNSVHFVARTRSDESLFSGIDCLKVEDLNDIQKVISSL